MSSSVKHLSRESGIRGLFVYFSLKKILYNPAGIRTPDPQFFFAAVLFILQCSGELSSESSLSSGKSFV